MSLDNLLDSGVEVVLSIFDYWKGLTLHVGGISVSAFVLLVTFFIMETLIPFLLKEVDD